ncbi:hypothetical protein Rsub_12551 [Raphidocelis subcapitata]|uniref:DUF98 domain-containing protein n=1 Tax=Raphidocelis subcapitata TaxID=307507 RepID=A0A2V0PJ72_9CHLO|nr:hypothetical protein Rsub_12551 [Raphidocelis subcapitata]|eukprot:GBF99851.1 hypothetical protein Rsub_12551 [Raphidocelis subcapitata]
MRAAAHHARPPRAEGAGLRTGSATAAGARARCAAAAQRTRPRPGAARAAATGSSAEASALTLEWHSVDRPALWQGPADTVLSPGSPASRLAPQWKMLLLSDGSVTRHLELLTGRETTVECLQMEELSGPASVPPAARRIATPLLQRQSLLRASSGPPLVYAASWWCAATVGSYLRDARRPIWASLAAGQVEVYREILEVYHGHSPELEALLQCPGPFWGRNYFFHHGGRPLTLIHEVFSNGLEAHLGPQWAQGAAAAAGGGGGAAEGPAAPRGGAGR